MIKFSVQITRFDQQAHPPATGAVVSVAPEAAFDSAFFGTDNLMSITTNDEKISLRSPNKHKEARAYNLCFAERELLQLLAAQLQAS